MADESGKSVSPTISSIAAPTADIDDEWASDDAEADPAPPAANAKAESPSSPVVEEAQKSGSPATEEIDSEWPDDAVSADQLRKPKIPLAPKLPEEAVGLGTKSSAPSSLRPSTSSSPAPAAKSAPGPSERPSSDASIDELERAASATGRGAFGIGASSAPPPPAASEPPAPSRPVPNEATATEPAHAPVASARPEPKARGRSSAPPPTPPSASQPAPAARDSAPPAAVAQGTRDSSAPAAAKPKKGGALVYGLAAAAVAIAGVGLAMRNPSGTERAIGRAQSALEPDPATKAGAKPARLEQASPKAPATPEPAPSAPAASSADAPSTDAPSTDAPEGAPAQEGDKGADADKGTDAAAAASAAPDPNALMHVKVNIYPADAQIYHKGKLVGRSGQEIELAPGDRKLLVLIRDGYYPRKLILDGKEMTINIGLRKQAEAAAAPTPAAPAEPKFTPPTP